jgi:hypothetical protein
MARKGAVRPAYGCRFGLGRYYDDLGLSTVMPSSSGLLLRGKQLSYGNLGSTNCATCKAWGHGSVLLGPFKVTSTREDDVIPIATIQLPPAPISFLAWWCPTVISVISPVASTPDKPTLVRMPIIRLESFGFQRHVSAEPIFSRSVPPVAPNPSASLFVSRVQGSTFFSESRVLLGLLAVRVALLLDSGLVAVLSGPGSACL